MNVELPALTDGLNVADGERIKEDVWVFGCNQWILGASFENEKDLEKTRL